MQASGGTADKAGSGISLRTFLVGMILLASVPIALLMSYQVLAGAMEEERRLHGRLQQASRAAAHLVNRELAASAEALKLLAREDGLRRDAPAVLQRMVREDGALYPGWHSIYLVDAQGQVLFDSAPGARGPEPGPRAAALPSVRQVAAVDGKSYTLIEVRAAMQGTPARVLGVRIATDHWLRLLQISLPPEAADDVVLADPGHDVIVRRSRPAGAGSYSAWSPIPLAGWSAGAVLRSEPVVAAQRRAVLAALGTAGGCLLVGVTLALLAARRVTTPLRLLAEGKTAAEGEGGDGIREITLLRAALLAAQEQDRESHERLQIKADEFEALFNGSPVALAVAQDTRCEEVLHNAAMTRLLAPRDLQAGGSRVLRRGRELPPDQQPLQHAARSGEPVAATELEIRLGEQRSVFVLAQAVPLRDAAGRPRGAISAYMDITERKLAEARLLSADQRLHEKQHLIDLAQEAGRVGFFHYQFDSDVLAWTPGQAKLFGLDDGHNDSTLGDWERRIEPQDRAGVEAALRDMLRRRTEKQTIECRVLPGGTAARWLSTRVLMTYAADGRPLQLIGVTMDVTDQKEVERERAALVEREQAARREAEAASRAKDEFLAMLGHELRNPLSAISSAAEVLNRSDPQAEVSGRARTIIGRQTRHLAHMVDDLLDVSRVISGKVLLSRSRVDLEALVRRVSTTLEVTGALRQHELKLDLQPACIDADTTRIEQVINNLLTNALKYTPAGGHIAVELRREDTQAVLRVRDDGFGIPPELLPRIFDLFVQGERTLDRRGGGLGIGLTLVRRLVELQGGRIEVASSSAGSVFELRFPALDQAAAEPAPARGAASGHPCRVAVIEDNDDALQALQSLLELDGHDVVTAVDGIAGLDAVLQQRPDVAVVDIGLPGLTGFEVARRSRAAGYTGRMIALSGYGLEQDIGQALEAGFDAHLVKPVDAAELRRLLAEA
ncbi:MAG: response regulator [Aquabacterium sp.]|jgi:signal transduction histidine kinase|nr:MAG: response regulator [Aquabacterium sp.]